jgi:hypothetical protein
MQTLRIQVDDDGMDFINLFTSGEADWAGLKVEDIKMMTVTLTDRGIDRLIRGLQLIKFVMQRGNIDLEEAKQRFSAESEDNDTKDPEPDEWSCFSHL